MTSQAQLFPDLTKCEGDRITFDDNAKGKIVGNDNITQGNIVINNVLFAKK